MWFGVPAATVFVACIHAVSSGCILSMKNDLTYNQPLILSTLTGSWYPLQHSPQGTLQLQQLETVKLVCPTTPGNPNAFATFPTKNEIVAKCSGGNRFEVDGKVYPFDQLQCKSPLQPAALTTGRQCISAKNEIIKVGYPISGSFVPAYEVCYDKTEKNPVYVEYEVSPDHAKNDAPVRESTWTNDAILTGTTDIDAEYTCPGQAATFHRISGKDYFKADERCCFARSQLASAADLPYAPQQIAAYHYLNAVPQWSTCNNRANWVEVERRIRKLSTILNRPLQVWSGTFLNVKLRSKWLIFSNNMYIHYNSKTEKSLPVPLYIWKVVHDPQTRTSLAIILLNQPHADLADATGSTLCRDKCHNVNWMSFLARSNMAAGYLYCCDLNDFELNFQMSGGPFPANSGRLLRDENDRGNWQS